MLNNFFRLNGQFKKLTKEKLLVLLETSKHICNVLYEPVSLEGLRISDIIFENVSFSKTQLRELTFKNCIFRDCLFIGTKFDVVELHDCSFEDCNFFKSTFVSVYAKPGQFRKAISDKRYANIAVHLYHELRENYYREAQREFKNEAEYYFRHWKRIYELFQLELKGNKWYQYGLKYYASWLYDYTMGYGYRLRNLVVTACFMIIIAMFLNHVLADYLFSAPADPSVTESIYFTVTTMTTLGASGYSPDTEVGYMCVVGNVLIGITILSATITAIFKKLIR